MQNPTGALRRAAQPLFAAALFWFFVIAAGLTLALGAGVYQNIVRRTEENHAMRTTLAYIQTRMRQNDRIEDGASAVRSARLGTLPALAFYETAGSTSYITYIYSDGGELRELYVQAGFEPSPASGQPIAAGADFSAQHIAPRRWLVTLTDADGAQALLHIASRAGGGNE